MDAAHPPAQRPGRHRDDDPTVPAVAGAEFDELMIERLLRGQPTDEPGTLPLSRLLAAARAPGSPEELRRAETVLAAFADRPRRRHGLVTRLLGVKAAAVLIVATATGGLALAAGTGVLPTPLHPGPAASQPRTSARPSAGTPESRRPSPLPSGSATPSLVALCAAYSAVSPSQREQVLDTAAYAPLVAAAGDADRVKAYCAALPEASPSGPKATSSHHPTGKPTTHPSHPTPDSKKR
ncbi:hypothetical protein [Hamadaea tsunoensis]|uniref:hypothetical protein n=1 Tax=Hamadaea tsunoensis TaxID=53368 RepID=UPI000404D6B2|nr:hypothetical protein [Hamadaea tsunoensis]